MIFSLPVFSDEFNSFVVINKPHLTFITVDVAQQQIDAVEHYRSRIKNFKSYQIRGEDFLDYVFPQMQKTVAFAYLDNFDWTWPNTWPIHVEEQTNLYKDTLNLELSNVNSQAAHLAQTELLLPFMSDRSIFLFDDTYTENGKLTGKGGTAVPFLLEQGWTVIPSVTTDWSIALSNFNAV